jgi:RecA/RadA recombinase
MTIDTDNKSRNIKTVIGSIEKQFGRGAIMALGNASDGSPDVGVIPSGSLALDDALGIGGYPRGRISEIYGPESSGKTTLSLHAIREAMKSGAVAAFIDAEHAFDLAYARAIGIDTERRSPTTASKRSRSSTCSRDRAPWISSSSTRSRRSPPRRRSRARWAMLTAGYRRGS